MPLNAAALTENPQYESQSPLEQVAVSESEEIKTNPTPPSMLPDVPEYQVISSSRLHTLKDLGEGAFGRVHLAEYNHLSSVSDSSSEKILVAVSTLSPNTLQKSS